jgi:hypothetical protein
MDTWPGEDEYPVTLNKYLYANTDPVLYSDPSGMWFTIADVSVSTRVNGGVRSTATAAERQAAELLHMLKDMLLDEVSGYALDLIMKEAGMSLVDALNEELEDTSKSGRSASSRGVSAHKKLEDRMKKINRDFLLKIDARVHAELFVDEDSKEQIDIPGKRPKGSIGIDIALYRPSGSTTPILLLDLKTGRGFSEGKRTRVQNALGVGKVPVIEIFVRKR